MGCQQVIKSIKVVDGMGVDKIGRGRDTKYVVRPHAKGLGKYGCPSDRNRYKKAVPGRREAESIYHGTSINQR